MLLPNQKVIIQELPFEFQVITFEFLKNKFQEKKINLIKILTIVKIQNAKLVTANPILEPTDLNAVFKKVTRTGAINAKKNDFTLNF